MHRRHVHRSWRRLALVLLLPCALASGDADKMRTQAGKLVYGVTTVTALGRLQRSSYKSMLNANKLERLRSKAQRNPADTSASAALNQYLRSTQVEAFGFMRKVILLGALFRGIESILEQELLYEEDALDEHTSTPRKRRRRRPRVTLATASAVIGLLALLEANTAPGVAAALHVGFHGSAWVWDRLATFSTASI